MSGWAKHRATYRRMAQGIWSVGCSCGWLCDHPLRGERSRAQATWRAHRDDVDTAAIGSLMTQRAVGAREVDL